MKIKHALAYAAAILELAAAAKAATLTGDFQYNNDKTTARTTLTVPHLTLRAAQQLMGDETTSRMLRAEARFNLDDVTLGLNARADRSGKDGAYTNGFVLSPVLKKGCLYLEPAWTVFDENGTVTQIDPCVMLTPSFGKLSTESVLFYLNQLDGEDCSAAYATAKGERLGVGVSKGYSDNLGLQVGVRDGKKGALTVLDYNPNTDSWSMTAWASPNAAGIVGPNGPAVWDDSMVIGYAAEKMPYFTGTANKAEDGGVAVKASVAGIENEATTAFAEIGYNMPGNFSASVSATHNFETGSTIPGATVTFSKGNMTIEGKATKDLEAEFDEGWTSSVYATVK
ncbi:MAG: hypothetical protein V1659_01025 [Candidatus Woesearchaeota archaeon]